MQMIARIIGFFSMSRMGAASIYFARILKSFIGVGFLLIALFSHDCCAAFVPLQQKQDFQEFVDEMSLHNHFSRHYLHQLFDDFRPNREVLEKINHPFEEQPWYIYRQLFVTPERIEQGVEYWHRHRTALAKAEKEYRVPASIIVAIVGVETFYGTVKPKIPVLQALTTLSFYYPLRAPFFEHELEEYLILTRELQLNPRKLRGSYAGAIGLPQFMPDSYRKFAVSYWNNGVRDLIHDSSDVIVSVANFLKQAGWQPNGPIAARIRLKRGDFLKIINDDVSPELYLAQVKSYDKNIGRDFPRDICFGALQLQQAKGYEHWLVYNNFMVLRHYNASELYVMAVFELSEQLKRRMFHQL